jgi:hypothetical protein
MVKATKVKLSAAVKGSQVRFHRNVKVEALKGKTFKVVRPAVKGSKRPVILRNVLTGHLVSVSVTKTALAA